MRTSNLFLFSIAKQNAITAAASMLDKRATSAAGSASPSHSAPASLLHSAAGKKARTSSFQFSNDKTAEFLYKPHTLTLVTSIQTCFFFEFFIIVFFLFFIYYSFFISKTFVWLSFLLKFHCFLNLFHNFLLNISF